MKMTKEYQRNCYYCNSYVTKKKHGWNARDGTGKIHGVHELCMDQEEQIILDTKDWERGERYSYIHVLTNPLARGIFIAKCGCMVSTLKDSPNGRCKFSSLNCLCMKHKILQLVNNPIGLNALCKWKWLRYLNKHFFSKLDKPLHTHYENLFREAYDTGIINDPYHEKKYGIIKVDTS